MDLLLDPIIHDIVFINGACPVTQERIDVVPQRLKIRLLTFLGEWVFNTAYGVPYMQSILGKKTSKEAVDNILREQILLEEGVAEILTFNSTFIERIYSLSFKFRCTDGTVANLTLDNIGL